MRKALASALVAALGASVNGQQPTFKTNVNAIVVDFRVVDANGAFVDNLTSDDIQVFEDGKPQEVSAFDLVKIPIGPSAEPTFAGHPVLPDTQSNERDAQRVYMVLLDDTKGNPLRSQTVRAIAKKFVNEYVQQADRVALTTTSGRKDMIVEFTGDKQRLFNAIDKYQGGYGAGSPLYELRALATWLSIPGRRKSIVYVSESLASGLPPLVTASETADLMDELELAKAVREPHTIFDLFNKYDGSGALDLRDVVEPAERNNVAIYAIDPTGAPGSPATDIKPTPFLSEAGTFQAVRPMLRSAIGQDALGVLATETGGAALLRSNDYDRAFTRIVQDSSSYYLASYTSSNQAKDGKFRRIEVRVRPGLFVRSRSGYLAASGKPPKPVAVPKGWTTELLNLIQSPIQVPGLTMDVGAAVFRDGRSAAVEVVVETRANGLGLEESGTRARGGVGLVLAVADADGHVKASHSGDLEMQLKPATRETVDDFGVRFLTRLKLKPGNYNMRVGSADGVGSLGGAVHYPLVVPNFSKGSLTMSGLVLESPAESHRPTTGEDKDWSKRFEQPPTAARRFWNRDELTVMAEVYNNEKKKDDIMVTTTVRNEEDVVVFKQQETLTGAETYARKTPIALKDFAAGKYLLTMEARNLSKSKAITSRDVVFSVTP